MSSTLKKSAETLTPLTNSGSSPPERFTPEPIPDVAATPSNEALFSRQNTNLDSLAPPKLAPPRSGHNAIMRSGSAYGSGRSSTALTTVKIAVVAPIPSANVTTAIKVKPGFFDSTRKP
jgi:hypothetical protein